MGWIKLNNKDNFDLNVPYYVPCGYPLISNYVRRKNLNISTATLLNMKLLSLPVFSYNNDEFSPNVNISDVDRLGYNLIENKLNIKLSTQQVKDSNRIEYLSEYIKENEISIVSGTSYYLPYTKDYLNSDYINSLKNGRHIGIVDHWLCAYGVTDETVSVYDPVPNNFKGDINKFKFMGFWRGDKGIKELEELDGVNHLLKYGILDINITDTLLDNEIICIIKELLLIIKSEYFNKNIINQDNNNFYYGEQAIEKLKDTFIYLVNNEHIDNGAQKIWRCFFEMKFSLLFLKHLVEESPHVFDVGLYLKLKDNLSKAIDLWGGIERIINSNMLRGNSISVVKNTVLKKLDLVIDIENKIYDSLAV